jgi:hypothetical protein
MDLHLTIPVVTLGSLATCMTLLAVAWVSRRVALYWNPRDSSGRDPWAGPDSRTGGVSNAYRQPGARRW